MFWLTAGRRMQLSDEMTPLLWIIMADGEWRISADRRLLAAVPDDGRRPSFSAASSVHSVAYLNVGQNSAALMKSQTRSFTSLNAR